MELVEGAAALRDLKLLVGSGCLAFSKGIAAMHALNKHVEQISFPVVLRIFRSWTAERLAASLSNPLLLKALSTNIGLQQPHSTTESTITVL